MAEVAGSSRPLPWHGAGCPSQKHVPCQEAWQLCCFTSVAVTAVLKAKYDYTELVRKWEPVQEEGLCQSPLLPPRSLLSGVNRGQEVEDEHGHLPGKRTHLSCGRGSPEGS